ncbi:DNA-directed RNA polymerase subunit F [Methanococcus voltae]|uniref:RNA polymerase Rpb4 family protein n=1 Tax=Methanococcus voltae TaxID=2188 RepID=UPI001AE70BDD|nr:RNA polymerase Rpb4 family protein [Methanococcus voltae]MBP2144330.1 DNA-directed RNA polymerase subunit F [Methanococcus voltae]
MIGKKLLAEKYTTIANATEIMNARAVIDEMSYENGCALDYLNKFSVLTKEEAEELYKELMDLGLDEKDAIKVIDILPVDMEDLKAVFYKKDAPENSEAILDAICKLI